MSDDSGAVAIHNSYWLRGRSLRAAYPQLDGDHQTEVLVIGAGITGLSTALELLNRGHGVTVCEANVIGAGTTGGSSGHLDAHPEMGCRKLVDQLGIDKARAYTQCRLDAINEIERRGDDTCLFTRVPAYHYTEDRSQVDGLREELDAAKSVGLAAEWAETVPMKRAAGGYRIDEMARFDCLAYLRRLAELVRDAGGTIFERTQIAGPTEKQPTSLDSGRGKVRFDHVVCAVHCNFTSSLRLYLQTPAYQSYVMAAKVASPLADALFWDNSDPYYYVRRATVDGRTILAGGCDHRTGSGDELADVDKLERWVRDRFDVEEIVTRWSAELFEPSDGLPFIGKVAGTENVWIATGLSGVGLTLGTAAGGILAGLIEGQSSELADAFSPSRVVPSSITKVAAEQVTTAANYAERVLPKHDIDPTQLAAGQGSVGHLNGQHAAVCRDQHGCLHRLKPICTHMGGVVHWNEAEQTWDCPVHGGRFSADGKRIYGPPEDGLPDIT